MHEYPFSFDHCIVCPLNYIFWLLFLVSTDFSINKNKNKILEKPEQAIKNGQSRKTDNICYTRDETKTNKTETQHYMRWAPLFASKHK